MSAILGALGWLIESPVGRGLLLALAGVVGLGLVYIRGYHDGEAVSTSRQRAQLAVAIQNAAQRAEVLQRRLSTAEQAAAAHVEAGAEQQRVIIREVVKYVQRSPSLADCRLDADGLRLWAAANAGHLDGAEPPGSNDAAVPRVATAGER